MRRREFIAGFSATAAWPLAARAQQPAMPVVGFLSAGVPAGSASNWTAFHKGLSDTGYVEGRNVVLDFRWTEKFDGLPTLAADLVRSRVAVIVTVANANAAQAAKAATGTIPIVFTLGADPVSIGVVASLNRPGGNVTGVTYYANELGPKRLEMLREIAPQAATIAFLVNPANSTTVVAIADMKMAAASVGQQIMVVSASNAGEIDAAFETMVRQGAGALIVNNDVFFFARRDQLIALAVRYRIPAIYFARAFTEAGARMSYSDDRFESDRQAAMYVGRVLKGEKPADLPVLRPVKFDLAINLKTAKALGLTVPLTLQVAADEVIE